jgi:tetratricopeptide (TPR) repeat protein
LKTKLFTAVFFFASLMAAQNYNWVRHDSLLVAGINQIYGIKFDDAEKTFSIVENEFPLHPAGKFFKAMITWWRIAVDLDNEGYDKHFYKQLEEVIDMCDEMLDKNPKNADAMFFKGGALGFRGRLLAIRESWFNAAMDGKEGLSLIIKAYQVNPKNVDIQLGFGIYHYYADVIPKKYPVVKPFMVFFPSGDKERGLRELENVAFNGRYAKIESRYFLVTLYYSFENDPDNTIKYLNLLLKDYPDNPVFERYYGSVLFKKNDFVQAEKVFRDVLHKASKNYFGYNDYARREAFYYLGDNFNKKNMLDSARVYFEKSEKLSWQLDKSKPSGFLQNLVLYLGMIYDQQGQRDKAIQYYNKVLDMKERGNSHTAAKQYLKTPYKK